MKTSNAMDCSVIICTYNRGNSLSDTLSALKAQIVSAEITWEVIVVDNNSKDHTRKVVTDMQQHWLLLRYEFECKQGLSHARNHGVQCAQGELIFFTDDDVLPDSDWIQTTLDGINQYKADACGGYIAPIWETPPPTWLTERFYGFLAVRTERKDDYLITDPGNTPFGANMAFRKKIFEHTGLFDTNRGRKGKELASGEDSELFERILAAKMKVMFLGNARVHHKVESFRLTKRYLRRWRFQTSRNLAISKNFSGDRRLFNIPLYLFPQFIRAVLRMLWGYLSQPKDEAFNRELIVCHFLGVMQGLHQMR